MRRGCISSGEIKCDNCQRTIPYSERYLVIAEKNGVEAEEGEIAHYCVECALEKGYASYKKEEKDSRVVTFFP